MKKLAVVFSGAGLSQESGIPTFRDSKTGLWENHKVEDVASLEGWERDQNLVLNFYAERLKNVKSSEPNEAHLSLARLQEKYRVVNITQNVDDLLERAGCEEVIHLHGTLFRRKCEKHKSISNLDGDTNYTCDFVEPQSEPVQVGELCPSCGGQLRPDVVWFGEAVDIDYHQVKELAKEAKYNDGVFICVGTSAQVAPASLLIPLFAQIKNKYLIDKGPISLSSFTVLKGNAGEKMKYLVDCLLSNTPVVNDHADKLANDIEQTKAFLKMLYPERFSHENENKDGKTN